MKSSLDILVRKVKQNMTNSFELNPNIERGISKLMKFVNFKRKERMANAYDDLISKMNQMEQRMGVTLNTLDRIIRRNWLHNLNKLRSYNRSMKALLLRNIFGRAERNHRIMMRDFIYRNRQNRGPKDGHYIQFAHLLKEIIQRKNFNEKGRAFGDMRQIFFDEKNQINRGGHLLGDLEELFFRRKQKAFDHIMDVLFSERKRTLRLKKLCDILDKYEARKALATGFGVILNDVKNGQRNQQIIQAVLEKIIFKNRCKTRDSLRRLTMNTISQWGIGDVFSHMNNLTDKSGFEGLKELLDLGKIMKSNSLNSRKKKAADGLRMAIQRVEDRLVNDGFERISAYSDYILHSLYSQSNIRWDLIRLKHLIARKKNSAMNIACGTVKIENFFGNNQWNSEELKTAFRSIKANLWEKKKYGKKGSGFCLLFNIEKRVNYRNIEASFGLVKASYTGKQLNAIDLQVQTRRSGGSLFSMINSNYDADFSNKMRIQKGAAESPDGDLKLSRNKSKLIFGGDQTRLGGRSKLIQKSKNTRRNNFSGSKRMTGGYETITEARTTGGNRYENSNGYETVTERRTGGKGLSSRYETIVEKKLIRRGKRY